MEYVGGGVDYNSGPYNVQFSVGVTRVSFDVSINNDFVLEGDEIFSLNVDSSSLPDHITVGDPGQATVTILANDGEYILFFIKYNCLKQMCSFEFKLA